MAWKKDVRWNMKRRQDFRRSWMSKTKACSGSCGEVRSFANMDPSFQGQAEGGMESGAGGNREKRTELLPEHQKVQKKSQKMQSLRVKQKNHLKTAGECEGEMQTLNKEWEEKKAHYETRFRALSERSGDSRKAAAELENEIQNLQASEERRGSSASQSNGWCFDPAILELAYIHGEVSRVYGGQHRRANCSGARSRSRREGSLGRRMGAAFGSAVDPAEGSDAVGGSLGGGKSQHSREWDTRS